MAASGRELQAYSGIDLHGSQLVNARLQQITGTGDIDNLVDGVIAWKSDTNRIVFVKTSALVVVPRADAAETVTGDWTFSRGSSLPPFFCAATLPAVGSTLTMVDNLNANYLKGYLPDAAANVSTIVLRDGSGRMKAATPSASDDVATKGWTIDTVYGIVTSKVECRAAATGNVSVSAAPAPGNAVWDGVTLATSDRIFLKNQTAGAENGIWIYNGSGNALTRSTDADTDSEVNPGMTTFVSEGATYGNTRWQLTTDGPIVVGTTALVFAQIGGATDIVEGSGIGKTGNTLWVKIGGTDVYTANRIIFAGSASTLSSSSALTWNGTTLAISGTITGVTSVNGLVITANTGVVTTGTWNGTAVAPDYGGTGLSSYAVGDILYASGSTTLAKLADVATGNALISGGVTTAPAWGKIGLTTHVSGTLPTANGGTNLTSFTANGVLYASSTSALATSANFTWNGTRLNLLSQDLPALGTAGGSLSFLRNDGLVGLFMGWDSSDFGWIQGQRTDSANASPLALQPRGGNVGIGVSAPGTPLQVNGGSSTTAIRATNGNFVSGTSGTVIDMSFGANTGNTYAGINVLTTGVTAWGNLILQSGGGKVGIGNISPSVELDVTGAFKLSGAATLSALTASKVVFTDGSKVLTSSGTIGVDQGGTGAATLALNAVLYGNGTSAIQALAVNSSATNKFLTQSSSGAPAWAQIVATDVNALAPTWTAQHIFQTDAIGETQTTANGIYLVNQTAAAAGAQQYSPAIRWRGRGWKTDATAASQSIDFRSYVRPVQGAAAPTGVWAMDVSIEGGAYADALTLSTAGALTITAGLTATGALFSGLTASKVVFTDGSKNLTSTGTVGPAQGGTGIASYAVGDILYASGATTLSALADVATGNALISGGVTTAPAWGKIGLTTHISGILGLANGGSAADLSAATTGGLVWKNTSALAVTGALTGVLIGTGSTAPTAVAGTSGKLAKWGTNTLADSIVTDNGSTVNVAGALTIAGNAAVFGYSTTLTTSATTYTVTHNLGTQKLLVLTQNISSGAFGITGYKPTSDNVIEVYFDIAPSASALRLVVMAFL